MLHSAKKLRSRRICGIPKKVNESIGMEIGFLMALVEDYLNQPFPKTGPWNSKYKMKRGEEPKDDNRAKRESRWEFVSSVETKPTKSR